MQDDDRRFVSDRERLALTLGPRTSADDLAGRFDGEDDGDGEG